MYACEAALTTEPIRAIMMSDHLVGDPPLSFLLGVLQKRIFFFKMYLLHKTLSLADACISLMIEMLVRRAVQSILSILC